jgi:hypothetical protein
VQQPAEFIECVWWRDTRPNAFEIYQPPVEPVLHVRAFRKPAKRIRWIGKAPLSKYHPLKLNLVPTRTRRPSLYATQRLLAVDNDETALAFVQACGLLWVTPDEMNDIEGAFRGGSTIEGIVDFAEAFRAFLLKVGDKPKRAFEILTAAEGELDVPLTAALIPDKQTGAVRMRYSVRTLREAIILQQSLLLAGGMEWRRCANCQTPFLAGPSGTRNKNATTCSQECKDAYHNQLKRLKGN